MPRSARFGFLLIALLLMVAVTGAQTTSWTAKIAMMSTSSQTPFYVQVALINQDGVQKAVTVPQTMGATDQTFGVDAIASDDLQYIVTSQFLGEGGAAVRIYDSVNDRCCIDVSNLLGEVDAIALGDFEPNGTRFVVTYVQMLFSETAPFSRGGIAIIDAATGQLLDNQTMEMVNSQIPLEAYAAWTRLGDWTANGIEFVENCYACDGGRFEGRYFLYNPQTQTYSVSNDYFTFFGDTLANGELLYGIFDQRYPYTPESFGGMFPIANVVQYFANGAPPTTSPIIFSEQPLPAPIVYANPQARVVNSVYWIGDGRAFLIEDRASAFWEIVQRGSTTPTRIPRESAVFALTGTPSGWLAASSRDNADNVLLAYRDQELTSQQLLTFPNGTTARVIDAPVQGQNANFGTFTAINPPTEPFAICEGLLPNRLRPNENARVTPGIPNRIRQSPDTTSEILGEIPGGATFTVRFGPSCDYDNNIPWWFVEYNGVSGWTAEGQNGDYFTEPAQ